MQKLFAYFDGSCGPKNPGGTAAYGFVIKNEEMEVIDTGCGRVCRGALATNNVAEVEGLYQVMLLVAQKYPKANVEFNGDSSLVIALMRGEAKARSGKYIPYYEKAAALAAPFIEKRLWKFRWIQRALNSEADELAQYHRF
jgi:ribonuclease HI